MKDLKHIFKSNRLSLEHKIRTFRSYIDSIFLYNSELWTITATLAKSIDSFHRRQLRYAINIQWPKKISNEDLYKKAKIIPWSKIILRRRLSWLGHLIRLPTETPARLALEETLKPSKKCRGRPPNTWLSMIKKDLIELNILTKSDTEDNVFIEKVETLATNRNQWKSLISGAISSY